MATCRSPAAPARVAPTGGRARAGFLRVGGLTGCLGTATATARSRLFGAGCGPTGGRGACGTVGTCGPTVPTRATLIPLGTCTTISGPRGCGGTCPNGGATAIIGAVRGAVRRLSSVLAGRRGSWALRGRCGTRTGTPPGGPRVRGTRTGRTRPTATACAPLARRRSDGSCLVLSTCFRRTSRSGRTIGVVPAAQRTTTLAPFGGLTRGSADSCPALLVGGPALSIDRVIFGKVTGRPIPPHARTMGAASHPRTALQTFSRYSAGQNATEAVDP